jgi:CheY-like chemotaxis protein
LIINMPRILLVEDEQVNREMFRRRLVARGFDVLTAENGEKAIEVVHAEMPALVLMDLGLPGIDGWEATRRLKAHPNSAGIPIIALSAHATADAKEKAVAAGCCDFETKPVQLDRLVEKLNAAIAKFPFPPPPPPEPAPTEDAVDLFGVTSAGGNILSPSANADSKTVVLRKSGAVQQPAPRLPDTKELPALAPAPGPEPDGKKRILVAEDNDPNRVMLCRRLEKHGYVPTEARNGREALDLVQRHKFDLLLCDIMMPEVDGYEVLRELKADPDLKALPVIMISALDEMESIVRCIEMGAEDYLPKPYDPVLLQARITACLDKRRLRDQELAYLRAVGDLTRAADAVEKGAFDPAVLAPIAARTDALGTLARVFDKMAREVQARERQLRQEVARLRVMVEIDQKKKDEELAAVASKIDELGLDKKVAEMRAARERRRAAKHPGPSSTSETMILPRLPEPGASPPADTR